MLSDNGNIVMPVSPMMGNSGFGGFGGDAGWWIILFLFAMMGGWGNGFGGFGGGSLAADGAMLDPWMNQSQQVNDGFRDQMINSSINNIQNSITSGFGDVQAALCNGFAQAEIAENGRQMANMNQLFGIQSALQNCCCENRANIADLKYTVATENCADRAAVNDGVRSIIASNTANTQAILDKLCSLELDSYKQENANLRSQLNMATLRESQTAQNAFITQGFNNEIDALYNRLSSCPVPSVPVYGKTNIFSCNNSCGCGM